MSHVPTVLKSLGRVLTYPDQHTPQAVELLYVVLQSVLPDAAKQAAEFGEFLEQHELWEAEEVFTRTFDVNPACALEVGWQLFGEEYARGMFLVRMREELRKYGLVESTELPDHIAHVLELVAVMPPDEAHRFVRACVQPAVEKMRQALESHESPYRQVIDCLAAVVTATWGEAKSTEVAGVLDSSAPRRDPLHAYPVADVGCGGGSCGGACGEPSIVPLDNLLVSSEKPPANAQATERTS